MSDPARQNFTVSISRDLLKTARILIARRGTFWSVIVAGLKRTMRNDARLEAGRRIKKRLALGCDLGTQGLALPRRDELHERQSR